MHEKLQLGRAKYRQWCLALEYTQRLDTGFKGKGSWHPSHEVRRKLASNSDFREENGHTCIMLPKFHCELNPIERCWAQEKPYTRAITNTQLEDCVERSLMLSTQWLLRTFVNITVTVRSGSTCMAISRELQLVLKIYTSHRRIGVNAWSLILLHNFTIHVHLQILPFSFLVVVLPNVSFFFGNCSFVYEERKKSMGEKILKSLFRYTCILCRMVYHGELFKRGKSKVRMTTYIHKQFTL